MNTNRSRRMTVKKTTNLQMYLLSQHQMGKDVMINENFDKLDKSIWPTIQDANINTPPATNLAGDGYIIGPSPNGDWTGKANNVAIYRDTAEWEFFAPKGGMMFFVLKKKAIFIFDGSVWKVQNIDTSNVPNFYNQDAIGIGSPTNQDTKFAVKTKNVILDGEDDIDLRINKKDTANVSKVTFQKGGSSRLEMGLIGEDDFKLRVSADGSRYNESFAVMKDTGQFIMKQGCYLENGIQFKGFNHSLTSYDEGTWRPVLEGSSVKGVASYEFQNGEFIRIGKMVYVFFFVKLSGAGLSGAGGNLIINGLPYPPSDANSFVSPVLINNIAGLSSGTVASCAAVLESNKGVALVSTNTIGYRPLDVSSSTPKLEVRGGLIYAVKQ